MNFTAELKQLDEVLRLQTLPPLPDLGDAAQDLSVAAQEVTQWAAHKKNMKDVKLSEDLLMNVTEAVVEAAASSAMEVAGDMLEEAEARPGNRSGHRSDRQQLENMTAALEAALDVLGNVTEVVADTAHLPPPSAALARVSLALGPPGWAAGKEPALSQHLKLEEKASRARAAANVLRSAADDLREVDEGAEREADGGGGRRHSGGAAVARLPLVGKWMELAERISLDRGATRVEIAAGLAGFFGVIVTAVSSVAIARRCVHRRNARQMAGGQAYLALGDAASALEAYHADCP